MTDHRATEPSESGSHEVDDGSRPSTVSALTDTLKEVVEQAEAGDHDAGMDLWALLATHREEGLDLSEMEPELVAWFDRRLEALTGVPAFAKMGARVTADEAARLITPDTRTVEETLVAMCLSPPAREGKRGPGRPRSKRKRVADAFLRREVSEGLAAEREALVAQGRGGSKVRLAPISRAVAARHGVSPKRVERAVTEAGEQPPEPDTQEFRTESDAVQFIRQLQAQGLQKVGALDEPLRPGTFKAFHGGGLYFVKFLEL